MNRQLSIDIWKPYTFGLKEINGMLCGVEAWIFTWSVSFRLEGHNRGGRFCFSSLQDALGFFNDWDGKKYPVVGNDGCTAIKGIL